MRALLLHANDFATKIIEQSTRPEGIHPEKKSTASESMKDCLVAFFCVEQNDEEEQVDELLREILKTAHEINVKNLMISPFVHLSKNIADPTKAKKFYDLLMAKLSPHDFTVHSSHFGYHKSLKLDIKGYPGSFRYREF